MTTITSGTRVEVPTHTDAWMFGDRYGSVITIGTKWVHVRMERSGRARAFPVGDLAWFRPTGMDKGTFFGSCYREGCDRKARFIPANMSEEPDSTRRYHCLECTDDTNGDTRP